MSEWSDEMVTGGEPAARPASAQRERAAPRRTFTESVTIGSLDARPDDAGDADQETITIGRRGGRVFTERQNKMLANIDKHGDVADAPAAVEPAKTESLPAAAGAADAGAVAASPAAATPAAAAAAPAPAADPATPDQAAEHRERADRLATHNQRLLAENAELRKRGATRELSAREKALDVAERGYFDDSVGSIRQLIAVAIGSDDPKSKEVDEELKGLYQDLTERELSVSLDTATKANREAARTRKILERDKRERKAETTTPAATPDPAEAARDAEHLSIISDWMTTEDAATKFPLLMKHSQYFDGMEPKNLVLSIIRNGFETGEFDPKSDDKKLIDAASRKIEAHYKSVADRFGPAPSTAAPTTQATVATDSKADPQGNGTRTITNASASVAPATPPAKKPETQTEEKPKFRNERERRAALAAKHFG